MHLRSSLPLVLVALLLSGCAATLQPAVEKPGLPEEYENRIDDVRSRMRAACVARDYQPYFRKTACLPSGITAAMMNDRTRITGEQKRAAERVFVLTHELNEETRRIMIESGVLELAQSAAASRAERDPMILELQNQLLEGRITWGEYNRARFSLYEQGSHPEPLPEAAGDETAPAGTAPAQSAR
ncbi:hypothetical protein [Sutterella sp.]|uniref:hypothetical protein n=1 Tax=Sutterella sp. TaxID=1981025 RepID=UPI0026DFEDC8|nr:hypothetical protein [Sutterella sp.]MDO5532728.1 hypothetical protein [Sutterella sp.]